MKSKYLLVSNIALVMLIILNIVTCDLNTNVISTDTYFSQDGKYISYLKVDNKEEAEVVELPVVEEVTEEKETLEPNKETNTLPKQEEKVIDTIKEEIPKEEVKEETPKNEEVVIETLIGTLVGYGPDCVGCTSNKTASGYYIGEGNIYYDDASYGKVRIVAGDYSYPFGTIVKISNVDYFNDVPFYAIVLDRGGDIGKNKKHLFDLLFAKEVDAYPMGKEINIKYEIVRLGY